MSQPIHFRSKGRTFLIGSIAGILAYALYLWLGKDDDLNWWLASNQGFGSAFGSIFFPVQYLIFCWGDYWPFSDLTAIIICFCLVAILYGYVFLGFRLFPKLAIWTFVFSIIGFLFSVIAFNQSCPAILLLAFWQVSEFNRFAAAAGMPPGPLNLTADCLIVGLWYASTVCGTWMLIRFPKVKSIGKAPDTNRPEALPIINCPQCRKSLRIPANVTKARCPACKAVFGSI